MQSARAARSGNYPIGEKVKGRGKPDLCPRHVAVLMFLLFRDVACKNKIKLAATLFEKTTAHAQLVDFLDQSLGKLQ